MHTLCGVATVPIPQWNRGNSGEVLGDCITLYHYNIIVKWGEVLGDCITLYHYNIIVKWGELLGDCITLYTLLWL